jgi:hypothetical protein
MAFPIAHDQYPNFVVGITAFPRFLRPAATLAWRAFERPRAFVRASHERLIRLGDTRQSLRLHGRRRGQKPVAPAKGCIAMNAGPGRRLANTLAVDQGLGEYTPSITIELAPKSWTAR